MIAPVAAAAIITAAFFVGAIPFGVLISRGVYRRDIRSSGSGNIGAANALRTLGKAGGAAVLVLDALKGALPVLAVTLHGGPQWLAAAAGTAAVLGHCYSPFLRGRGGKGVATSYGAIWALAWPAAAAFTLLWIGVVIATGFASLASIVASLAMPFALWFMLGRIGLWYGIVAAGIIIWQHRANLARLRAGTENVINFGRSRADAPPPRPLAIALLGTLRRRFF